MATAVTKGTALPPSWHAFLHDSGVQLDFPDAGPLPSPPGWFTGLVHFIAAHRRVFEYAGWTLLAIFVGALVYFLVRWLMRQSWERTEAPPVRVMAPWQPDARQARLLLRDADALAEAGRFGEAVHLMLLVSIQEIGDRRPGAVMPALTSREIASLEVLSPMARKIFFAIAQVVERSVFGARSLTAEEFVQCRAAFEQFTVAEVWRAAA